MTFILWYLIIGGILVAMALAGSVLKRLPLTASMFYLAIGAALGPPGADLLRIDLLRDAHLLERFTEVAVIISLFTAGLKLRLPLSDRRWRPPFRMASLAMVLTVAGVAAVGVLALGLSLGAAVLLGAVLAPTDPVLASDVQVTHAGDKEDVRFALTGEAGLNDGMAFPFVMLAWGSSVSTSWAPPGRAGSPWTSSGPLVPGCWWEPAAERWSAAWCSICAANIGRPSGSTSSWRLD